MTLKPLALSLALALGVPASANASTFFLTVPLAPVGTAVSDIVLDLKPASLPQAFVGEMYATDLAPLFSVTGDSRYDEASKRWEILGRSGNMAVDPHTGALTGLLRLPGIVSVSVRASYKGKSVMRTYDLNVAERQSILAPLGDLSQLWGGIPLSSLPVQRQLTLSNIGDAAMSLTVSGLTSPFKLVSNTCQEVAPGATCSLTLELGYLTGSRIVSSNLIITGADQGNDTKTVEALGTGTYSIVAFGEGRRYQDGTYASSCNGYLHSNGLYAYSGATGSGVYTLDPDGPGPQAPIEAYCDMTTDGGGWTLTSNISRGIDAAPYFNQAGGPRSVALSPINPSGVAHAGIGTDRWSGNFPFSQAKVVLFAHLNEQQRMTFYKSITQTNLQTWGIAGATEPNPSTACTDLNMTQNCSASQFDHTYLDGVTTHILMLRGMTPAKYGYLGDGHPLHLSIMSTAGVCSTTADANNNVWQDSFNDGHWGNGMQVWLR